MKKLTIQTRLSRLERKVASALSGAVKPRKLLLASQARLETEIELLSKKAKRIDDIEEQLSDISKALWVADELAEAVEDFLSEDCAITRERMSQAVKLFRARVPSGHSETNMKILRAV